MLPRLTAPTLTALLLAAAVPAGASSLDADPTDPMAAWEDEPDPLALARVVSEGTVQVMAAGSADFGSLLPLCQVVDAEPDQTLAGTISDGCFQPVGGAQCEAFIVGVNPDYTPPKVVANPNWMCIERTIDRLLGDPLLRPLVRTET